MLHSNACQPMTKWYSLIWYPLYIWYNRYYLMHEKDSLNQWRRPNLILIEHGKLNLQRRLKSWLIVNWYTQVRFVRRRNFSYFNRPSGRLRTSTSSPSWICKFLVSVRRLLLCMQEVCSPTMKVMDENKNVPTTFRTGTRASKIQDGEEVDHHIFRIQKF